MLVPLDTVRTDDVEAKLAGALDVEAGSLAVRLTEAVLATAVVKFLAWLVLVTLVPTAVAIASVATEAGAAPVGWQNGDVRIAGGTLG